MSNSGSLQRPPRPSRKIFLSSRHKTGKFRKTIKRARTITSADEKTRPGPCRLCRVRLTIYAFNPHRGCQSPESAYRA